MVVALPIVTMLLSDLALGFYSPMLMASVYLSLAMAAALGESFVPNPRLGFAAGAMLAGSVLFFLCTNFAVWAGSQWYTRTSRAWGALFYARPAVLPLHAHVGRALRVRDLRRVALARRFGARAAVATA